MLKRVLDVVANFLFIVSGAALVASVGLAFTAVVMRYGFSFSLEWIEEAARYLALFAAFTAAGPVLRSNGHIALDILVSGLTGHRKQLHWFAVNLAVFLISGAICTWGTGLALQTYEYGGLTASLQFPQWLPYSIVPLGMGILVVFSLAEMIGAIQAMRAVQQAPESDYSA